MTTISKLNETEHKLYELLQENTGRVLVDSGGAYGRHWERNRGVDFAAQPEGELTVYVRKETEHLFGQVDICATLNVFHFLRERVAYNRALDEQFREYVEKKDLHLDYHAGIDFATSIGGMGIYRDGEPFVTNTYNGEDLLSQIIQFVYWTDEDNGDAHILLQIHGGCDSRWGYTDPVAFDVTDYEGLSIFDNAQATIYCDDCGKHWDTEDGYRWYEENHRQPELGTYPATVDRDEIDYPEKQDPAQRTFPIELSERPQPCAGIVWVDNDRQPHCPYCGGLLKLVPWPAG